MMYKKVKEWFLDTVFGKVALISWGDPAHPPILMVHGYMDTAATFTFLQDQLPDRYYYVAFDIPGHGKSCRLPVGPPPSQPVAVETLRAVVEHMGWDSFVLIGHSMGGVIGMFYSFIYPGKVTKILLIDPLLALCGYFYMTYDMTSFYGFFYDEYYTNNILSHSASDKLLSYEEAVSLTAKNRELTREKAEAVLSRSLEPATEGLYRFSTQPISKKIGVFPIQTDVLFAIMSSQPPMLTLVATRQKYESRLNNFVHQLQRILKKENKTLFVFEGHHNTHISNPEALTPFIVEFLNQDNLVRNKKAKL